MKRLIPGLALAVLTVSCSGNGPAREPAAPHITLAPLGDTSIGGLQLHTDASEVVLHMGELPAEGRFVVLRASSGQFGVCTWELNGAEEHVLTLAVETDRGIELGAIPLAAYQGEPVSAFFKVNTARKASSTKPKAAAEVIQLGVAEAGLGQVGLSWTQVLPGDYDHNGEVNASDLQPLAARIRMTYDRTLSDVLANPLYWSDGDQNGEVNLADIVPIARNYGVGVSGYSLRRNMRPVPGDGPNGMLVDARERQPRHGLPSRYNIITEGEVSDSWHVIPELVSGAFGSPDVTGGGELLLRIDLGDLELQDLPAGPPKVGTRVIDPIEDVKRAPALTPELIDEDTLLFRHVPQGRIMLAELFYTLPEGPSADQGIHETSAGAPEGARVTSIPFELPMGCARVEIDVRLEPEPMLTGGLLLTSTVRSEGGPLIENRVQLDFEGRVLRRDMNYDGEFNGEIGFADSDGNGVSDAADVMLAATVPSLPGTRRQFRLGGEILTTDYAAGQMEVLVDDTGEHLTLLFCEMMGLGFTPEGHKPRPGDTLDAVVFSLPGAPVGTLWLQELRNGGQAAMELKLTVDPTSGERRLDWNSDHLSFVSYRIARWSHGFPYGWCSLDFDAILSTSRVPVYFDSAGDLEQAHLYELYGRSHAGEEIFLDAVFSTGDTNGEESGGESDSVDTFHYFF